MTLAHVSIPCDVFNLSVRLGSSPHAQTEGALVDQIREIVAAVHDERLTVGVGREGA